MSNSNMSLANASLRRFQYKKPAATSFHKSKKSSDLGGRVEFENCNARYKVNVAPI